MRLRLENGGSSGRTWEIVGGLPGANNSNFSIYDVTAATTRATITAAGDMGLGTTSPTTFSLSGRHFEVDGSNGSYSFIHNRTANVRSFYAVNESSGLAALYTFTNHPLVFGTNNTERARITAAGNLGIGTTSPAYSLQVQKTATATPAFMIGGGFFGGPRLQVYGLDDNGTAWMGMGTDMSAGIYELSIYYTKSSGNGRISFGTYNGTTYT